MARKRLTVGITEISKESAWEQFIMFLTVKNVVPDTIRNYTKGWKYFNQFYDGELQELDRFVINKWVIFMKEAGMKIVTMNSYLRLMRTFINFCSAENWIEPIKVHLMSEQQVCKETYSEDDLKKLLVRPVKNKCTFTDYRDWVIVNTLIGTGIRRTSLLTIKVQDVDFSNGLIQILHTKNKKALVLPMSTSLQIILHEYVLAIRAKPDSWLFSDTFGEQLKPFRLSHLVANYNKRHGVKITSVHAYRHTYAKMMILNGCDVFRLQKLLGHQSLDMTKRYVDLFAIDLKQGYDSICPLDKLSMNRQRIRIG